jgi:mRNA interferase YafQ
MLDVKASSKFKTSFKRVSKNKSFEHETFEYIIFLLASQTELPEKFRDHELSGRHKDKRECHLAPDVLLIYSVDGDVLILNLLDIGSHSSLFR